MVSRAAAIVALALAAWLLASPVLADDSKCVLKEVGEFDVSPGRGVALTTAQLNGRPAQFIVDTGSFATSLFRSTAEKLGLRVKVIDHARVFGLGGEVGMGEVRLNAFKVGSLAAHDIDLAVIGSGEGDLAGLLGIQFLRQADIEFDYPEGKIRFFKPENCAGDQVVYWGMAYASEPIRSNDPEGTIEVQVNISGQKVLAVMDSGAQATTVAPVLAERLAASPLQAAGEKIHGIGAGTLDVVNTRFDSFSFGEETIHNAKLDVAELGQHQKEVRLGSRLATAAIDQPEVILGADFFRSHRIYVSKSQRKVYVSYMGGPVFGARAGARPGPVPQASAAP